MELPQESERQTEDVLFSNMWIFVCTWWERVSACLCVMWDFFRITSTDLCIFIHYLRRLILMVELHLPGMKLLGDCFCSRWGVEPVQTSIPPVLGKPHCLSRYLEVPKLPSFILERGKTSGFLLLFTSLVLLMLNTGVAENQSLLD